MNHPQRVSLLKRTYSDPDDYVHRLIFGVGAIRDCAIRDKKERLEYDTSLSALIQNLTEMKIAINKSKEIIISHSQAVLEQKDAILTNTQITVTDPVDSELNLLFKDIFIRGMMVTRCLNNHARLSGYNIEFMFSDEEDKFTKGAKNFPLDKDDARFVNLAAFIKNHKVAWYNAFRSLRKEIEHMGWSLPEVQYRVNEKYRVEALFPNVENLPIPQLCDLVWQNMVLLCEEVCVYLLSLKLPEDMIIVRVPENQREQHNKARYIVSHKTMPGVPLGCS